METKIKVTTKFRCKGQDYESIEEMPSDLRGACEQAIASLKDSGEVQGGNSTRVILNGTTYESVEELPADVRQLYERAIGSIGGKRGNPWAPRAIAVLISLLGLVALAASLLAARGWPM